MPPLGALRGHWPVGAALLCLLLAWQPAFTGGALRANDQVLSSAIKVYAVLRSINAAVSVIKETEIGFDFIGSATTQPGMVLDPVDDTVTRVADAVFALAAVSGVLDIGLVPIARLGALTAALGFALVSAARLWPGAAGLGRSLAQLGLVLALALPLGYAAGGKLGQLATDDALEQAEAALDGTARDLDQVAAAGAAARNTAATAGAPQDSLPAAASETSLWQRMLAQAGDSVSGARDGIGAVLPDLDATLGRAGEIFESALTIVAVYVFRLLVLPALLLWLIVLLARRAVG